MISEKVELDRILPLIRREIESSEVAKKIMELDSKLVELRKALEGIVIELTYIKSELKELRDSKERKPAQTQLKDEKTVEKQTKEGTKVDTKRDKSEVEKKFEESEKTDDKDIIICD